MASSVGAENGRRSASVEIDTSPEWNTHIESAIVRIDVEASPSSPTLPSLTLRILYGHTYVME